MSLKSLLQAWNQFFFTKQSPVPIALFRIIYGTLVAITLALLWPDWLEWYGVHAWLSRATAVKLESGTRINVFTLIPQNDAWIYALFWLTLIASILVAIGLFTRLNSIILYLCLVSIQQRNLYITHGGDTFLRIAGFFLIFAPAGAAWSVDRLIAVRRASATSTVHQQAPWAQRMIQVQLSFLYLTTFLVKLKGNPWLHGSALFYVYHLDEFRRFPLPMWFFHPLALKLAAWMTLAIEFSLGVLIWIKEFRYILLALGLIFHLCLEYSLNIPMFQWDVLSAYVLFVDGSDLEKMRQRVSDVSSGFTRSCAARLKVSKHARPLGSLEMEGCGQQTETTK